MTKNITKEQKQELDDFVNFAVNNNCLSEDTAQEMSYKDKQDYFNQAELKANDKGD